MVIKKFHYIKKTAKIVSKFYCIYNFTLSVESSAESLALFLGLEFISITAAAAVDERLTHLMRGIVIIRGDRVVAIAGIDRRQTDLALRFFDRWYSSNFRRCNDGRLSFALPFAGFYILEAILITLTTAVLELIAGIAALIVVKLFHEAVAGSDHFR